MSDSNRGARPSKIAGGTASPPKGSNGDATVSNAIEVEHIVKKYGDFTAVDDVTFSVKDGEILR